VTLASVNAAIALVMLSRIVDISCQLQIKLDAAAPPHPINQIAPLRISSADCGEFMVAARRIVAAER
jgi:hypothetical protein